MHFSTCSIPLLLLLQPKVLIAYPVTFNLADEYAGQSFFDKWDFYGHWDNLTLGDVNWVTRADAISKELAYVNSAGNAIIKVSTDTVVYNNKRDSVRITTQQEYPVGTIWITDIVHMPFGCSTWPAIWTTGQNWPYDGEIDILEGINLNTNNEMTVHTRSGCTHVATPNQTGRLLETDCSTDAGCTVADSSTASYGDAFNKAGGGVWATQFTADGIKIWFWTRSKIPSSITSLAGSKSSITFQSDWGIPAANYPSGSNCDTQTFFSPQRMVIDITLCGEWAKSPQFYHPQCGNMGPTMGMTACYTDNVLGNGSNYQDVYFEIKYVRAYIDSTVSRASSTTGGSPISNIGSLSSSAEVVWVPAFFFTTAIIAVGRIMISALL